MTKKTKLAPEDRELFRNTIGQVKRLHHDRIEPSSIAPAPLPRSTWTDERQVLVDMVSDYFEPVDMETGEEIHYCRAGLQHTILRRLKRGQFRVSAVLDLHGMTVATAREALNGFLHSAQRDHLSCVRIIHGKGNRSRNRGPVLKHKVNHWLRQRDDVLAFCSARPVDGGTGAIYLLLRRR